MTTKRRRKNKNTLTVIFFLLLLVAAGVICYLVWDNYFRDKGSDEPKPATVEQVIDNPVIKDGKGGAEDEKTPEPEKKEVPAQYDGDNPNNAGGITGVITYAGVNGSYLMIRVNIDQYLNGGTCKLSLKQNGSEVYTASAPVIDAASTSTCEGFNVPVSGLSNGTVSISIAVSSGDKSGTITGSASL